MAVRFLEFSCLLYFPEGKLEKFEALEQLRALEYGYKIKVVITPYDSVEVDNKQELEKVRRILTVQQ
ncbi:hypothetical protein DS62_12175 [Smithella sp. SC_K08D17]|nr:hypothetical protein KD27_01295 [Smithella sp. D17]KIE18278.1 hypothetical protein DS62_12175 [Smithella sp. SC_K08D17]